MSDGSLSQDEIDALLSGVDAGPGAAAGGRPSSQGLSDQERRSFLEVLESISGTQGSNLSMMMGQTVSFQSPSLDGVTRDQMLQAIPEEVLAVKVDFTQGFSGDHLFVMSKETALRIASLANKEEGLDLDDMAISAVQEVMSTVTGTEVTVLSEKTGNRAIATSSAEGKFGPKAIVQFPLSDFARVQYNLVIGDNPPEKFFEIFSSQFIKDVAQSLSGGSPSSSSQASGFDMPDFGGGAAAQGGQAWQKQAQANPMQAMGGMQGMTPMPQMGQGMQMGQAMPQGYGQMPMGMPMGGYAPAPMQGGYGMQAPNVQSVQFPTFTQQSVSQEGGNIGLIMDVFMEMTVELGRTKKLIREILGMGEGTIIELDKLAGEPVDILVNHKLIAKGEVVVIDENFGVRVTEIVTPVERITDMT
jgi:flagellar motor switch protein FliN